MPRAASRRPAAVLLSLALLACAGLAVYTVSGQGAGASPTVTVSSDFPADIPGGAAAADLTTAAQFAWQEFIALNWPAAGSPRDTPDTSKRFGQPGTTVWETFRGKVEIYPGTPAAQPHGFVDDPARSYGYDDPPKYVYSPDTFPPDGMVPPCSGTPSSTTPWINADEKSQIGLDQMYAGIGPTGGATGGPGQQILFLAKANRQQYMTSVMPRPSAPTRVYSQAPDQIDPKVYGLWNHANLGAQPYDTDNAAFNALVYNMVVPYSAGQGPSGPVVEFPSGTVEAKAAFRKLGPNEDASRYHVQPVRYYQPGPAPGGTCYVDEELALVALHIIHKTPSAPYFVYATFEQTDNIVLPDGTPVEDADGNVVHDPGTTPFVPAISTTTDPGQGVQVRLASGDQPSQIQQFVSTQYPPAGSYGPQVHCQTGDRLYYVNTPKTPQPQGVVCVTERVHPIPQEVIAVNHAAHQAIASYDQANGVTGSPWPYYKLVNVQWKPMDKPAGQIYTGGGTLDPSTYYLANSVVETDYNLQVFSGQFQNGFPNDTPNTTNLITDYWGSTAPMAGKPFHNIELSGQRYNMGGCMGCHGNAAVNNGTDFSFILQSGRLDEPEKIQPPALIFEDTRKYRHMRQQAEAIDAD